MGADHGSLPDCDKRAAGGDAGELYEIAAV